MRVRGPEPGLGPGLHKLGDGHAVLLTDLVKETNGVVLNGHS